MVKVELKYNPYTLKTDVTFNGKAPRINSLVEKYQNKILQEWIDELPSIFYNEMNGYGFELEYTGTEKDYNDLKEVFKNADIGENLVRIIHKSVMEDRNTALSRIDDIDKWLNECPNDRFDIDMYNKDNIRLKDGINTFIIVEGREVDISAYEGTNISFEYIDDIESLSKTELSYTPILIYVSNQSLANLNKSVRYILSRDDIQNRQVFYMIDSKMNTNEITRIIVDLGVERPQIIAAIDDKLVKSYISVYPLTSYIYSYLSMLRDRVGTIQNELELEKSELDENNKLIYNRINVIDDLIERVRTVIGYFDKRDEITIPDEWNDCADSIDNSIYGWREKKTRISTKSEYDEYSSELNGFISEQWNQYVDSMNKLFENSCQSIADKYHLEYSEISYEEDYRPTISMPKFEMASDLDDIRPSLAELGHVENVAPKEDILGKLFGSGSATSDESVVETAYYFKEWRETASRLVGSRMADVIKNCVEKLNQYSDNLVYVYLDKLVTILDEESNHRDQILSELSSGDYAIKEDMNWIIELKNKISIAERG